MNYSNFNSFEEFSASPVGNGADMPKPGNFSSVISKSGGNTYHGSVYQDYENDKMEAYNIDDAQIALGVSGAGQRRVRATSTVSRAPTTSAAIWAGSS